MIVDGFHRYRIMLDYQDIYEREGGNAAGIGHRQAAGPAGWPAPSATTGPEARHDVDLMSNIISELHELGRSDAWISRHLGMDKDEILRLKQITGLTALFKEVEFGRAWKAIENDLQDEWEEVEK